VLDVATTVIADVIEQFAELPAEERRKMGKRGREYIVEHHTWDRLPEMVLEDR
jgi:glycosyltransferase involved in cell wall biosynthesis